MKTFLRRIRLRLRAVIGRDICIKRDLRLPVEYHGSLHGGWAVIKNSLGLDSIVYSVGIGEDASFDLSLINKYHCSVYAFDPTPKAMRWAQANIMEEKFHLSGIALSAHDGVLRLYLPRNENHVSASVERSSLTAGNFFDAPSLRLSSLMAKFGHSEVNVLKMDIEGAEYAVLAEMAASGSLACVEQLLVEFHHWIPEIECRRTLDTLGLLRKHGFRIAWVSEWGYEVLFKRDGRV
jgi:FkbM family methyltransferase